MFRLISLIKILPVILIVVAALVFANHNPTLVTVNYLLGEFTESLGVLLVYVVCATVGATLLASLLFMLAGKSELRKLRKKLNAAEQELKNLRSLPIKDA